VRTRTLLPIALSALAVGSLPVAVSAGEIQAALEEPANGLFLSGLGKLQGWAFSSVALDRIEFYLDGDYLFNVPGGATRQDVANQFPGSPNAAFSGFAAGLNYNILGTGPHTIGVKVVDVDGDTWEQSVNITVDYFTDDGFTTDVSLNGAVVSGSGNTITIENFGVEGEQFDLSLNWQTPIQSFGYSSLAAAAGGGGGGGGGSTGECVTLPIPANGSRVVWSISGTSSGTSVSGTVDTTYTSVSETSATTQTDSTTSGGGVSSTSDTTTVQTYSVQTNGQGIPDLYVSQIKVNGSASAGGFNQSINSTISFSPAKLFGPWRKFCEGYTWQAPSVQQTVTGAGTSNTPVDNGEVISINESVTVPAGTFTTVHRRVTQVGGSVTDAWFDVESGHEVKQVSTTGGDTTTSVATTLDP